MRGIPCSHLKLGLRKAADVVNADREALFIVRGTDDFRNSARLKITL